MNKIDLLEKIFDPPTLPERQISSLPKLKQTLKQSNYTKKLVRINKKLKLILLNENDPKSFLRNIHEIVGKQQHPVHTKFDSFKIDSFNDLL